MNPTYQLRIEDTRKSGFCVVAVECMRRDNGDLKILFTDRNSAVHDEMMGQCGGEKGAYLISNRAAQRSAQLRSVTSPPFFFHHHGPAPLRCTLVCYGRMYTLERFMFISFANNPLFL